MNAGVGAIILPRTQEFKFKEEMRDKAQATASQAPPK